MFPVSVFLLAAASWANLEELREDISKKSRTENAEKPLTLLNASFDPTRGLYTEINQKFIAWWKSKTGQSIEILQSHGGSGKQARAVALGLQADVVTLALAPDIDAIHFLSSNTLSKDWSQRLPNHSTPFTSTIVFLVRKGNPKNIKEWDDLVKDGVSVITPNPKTSGGARWNYLAAWGYALKKFNGNKEEAKNFLRRLFKNVPILDTGARGSTITFAQRGIGDLLVTWENEAYLVLDEFGRDKFEIIAPSVSVKAELPVTWIDAVVARKGSGDAAKHYLAFLYMPEAQKIAAQHYLRPIDDKILQEYAQQFPTIPLFEVDRDLGGWELMQKEHFSEGGLFDQIYLRQ